MYKIVGKTFGGLENMVYLCRIINKNRDMEIKGKVHCFFEQSGTFKNEFIKLGYQAERFDPCQK